VCPNLVSVHFYAIPISQIFLFTCLLPFLTLGAYAQRGLVGLSVNHYLTSGVYMFILKRISRTQQDRKVKLFVWISLKPLHCRDTPLLPLYGYSCVRPFWKPRMLILIAHAFSWIRAHVAPRILHFRVHSLVSHQVNLVYQR